MRSEVLILALIVGACTWAFRYLPLRADLRDLPPDGPWARFLGATGPAAIATLFVAEVMPLLRPPLTGLVPLGMGVAAVVAVFVWRKSAVLATLAGSLAYGIAFALLG
jgi:branched-subunit amino acid transport protein